MVHELKAFPANFSTIERGEKNFEIRNNIDRSFQKGDTVIFNEYNSTKSMKDAECFTGKKIMVKINHISGFKQQENFVVFGFSLMSEVYIEK